MITDEQLNALIQAIGKRCAVCNRDVDAVRAYRNVENFTQGLMFCCHGKVETLIISDAMGRMPRRLVYYSPFARFASALYPADERTGMWPESDLQPGQILANKDGTPVGIATTGTSAGGTFTFGTVPPSSAPPYYIADNAGEVVAAIYPDEMELEYANPSWYPRAPKPKKEEPKFDYLLPAPKPRIIELD